MPSDLLAHIPPPSPRRLALRVTREAQRAIRQGHPWVFRQSVTGQGEEGRPGDLAVIFDDYRRFLAIGLYDPTSPIRVRVLAHGEPAPINRAWFEGRLAAAADWRATLPEEGTTGYRLVHGENDGLPGLVIDRYDSTLVIKLYTAAWVPHLATLYAALTAYPISSPASILSGARRTASTDARDPLPAPCEAEGCGPRDEGAPPPSTSGDGPPLRMLRSGLAERLVLRLSRELMRQPETLYGLTDGMVLAGPPLDGPVAFSENGLRFEADIVQGQKTGFFFDQRDNRARVEKLAAAYGLPQGCRVLNVFAYSGGFSLYAARGGAAEILSIDASAPALAAAERNFTLNQDAPAVRAARHQVLVADAFDALTELAGRKERFDLVIVDPPALAKQASEIPAALAAYGRLTAMALGVLAPGGTLVMASCSSRVSAPAFFRAVNQAAAHARRPLQEIDRTGHAIDHPVRFPEGAYLKCLYATAP